MNKNHDPFQRRPWTIGEDDGTFIYVDLPGTARFFVRVERGSSLTRNIINDGLVSDRKPGAHGELEAGEAEAIAQAIAALPELVEACQTAIADLRSGGKVRAEKLHAALRKAGRC